MIFSKFINKLRNRPGLIFDCAAIPFAWFFAYCFRYNLKPFTFTPSKMVVFEVLCMLCLVQVSCYFHFRIYKGLWRYFSLNDVVRILKAVTAAVFFIIPSLYACSLLQYVPRSVIPLYGIILVGLLCSARLVVRVYIEKKDSNLEGKPLQQQRVLIVGAGQAGQGLLRDMQRSASCKVVGFVDDKFEKLNMEVHGVSVLGHIGQIPELVKSLQIDLIFIAIPSARSADMRTIVSYCEKSNIPFRTLPGLEAFLAGFVSVKALREVSIEDLLGRDQVSLEWEKISREISGKKVLVTGAGGSIGAELCRQIMRLMPQELILIENSEFNLYQIEGELRQQFPYIPIHAILLSVADESGIKNCFKIYTPQIVFHAAAYKHVPMLENQIRVAVMNNVLGTRLVAQASVEAEVEKFILISTDKAVNPANVMGTTKRVAEIFCQNFNVRVKTRFITVRFGNVLGSAGSVLPLFQQQLAAGGPLTVTHPDIQRYFMTIPEACQLILQAMANGAGGEIFVLDMGEPVRIAYLAEQLIRLAGKEPGKDIQIQYTGLRPGEKLFEELFHEAEQLIETEHEKLFKAQFRKLDWEDLNNTLRMLQQACMDHQEDEILLLLKSLVPEFQSLSLGLERV